LRSTFAETCPLLCAALAPHGSSCVRFGCLKAVPSAQNDQILPPLSRSRTAPRFSCDDGSADFFVCDEKALAVGALPPLLATRLRVCVCVCVERESLILRPMIENSYLAFHTRTTDVAPTAPRVHTWPRCLSCAGSTILTISNHCARLVMSCCCVLTCPPPTCPFTADGNQGQQSRLGPQQARVVQGHPVRQTPRCPLCKHGVVVQCPSPFSTR
jgi:hypothetical protein